MNRARELVELRDEAWRVEVAGDILAVLVRLLLLATAVVVTVVRAVLVCVTVVDAKDTTNQIKSI